MTPNLKKQSEEYMRGTGNRFWLIITMVFVAIDIVLLIAVGRIRKSDSTISTMFWERQGQIEEIMDAFIETDEWRIRGFLDDQDAAKERDSCLIMIIPLYPCSACLDRESLFFKNFAELGLVKCYIFVPDNRFRDAKALFSKTKNLFISPYSTHTQNDMYWSNSEKIIYCLQSGNYITNIMITSKYSESASEHYFKHIQELLISGNKCDM